MRVILSFCLFILVLLQFDSAYAASQSKTSNDNLSIQINADGATFPYPLISKWQTEYEKLYPNIQFNYEAVGSGTGVKDFIGMKSDFGASDAPLSNTEREKAGDVLHIPETIGAVVIVYNVPGISKGLNLTGTVLGDIFLGKVTNWNDKEIQDLNPGFKLPSKSITVVHRSDGSGTTFVFTDYLSKASQDWFTFIGKGKSVSWPTGVGAPQNDGVAQTILKNQYSVGYVELAYVLQHNMTNVKIRNGEGTSFVEPSEESISAAVKESSSTLPSSDGDWSQVSIVNSLGSDSYPISSMTYLLVHQDLGKVPGMTKNKANAVINLIHWMVNDGQKYAPDLQYVMLPDSIREKDDQALSSITFNGESLYKYKTTPEFGEIVPLILAIAIISIIAITHRTKLVNH